ncbi:undecaprenyl-phosphate glucose phosphotransferase [Allomuricauda sp. SCSIO 65647]|uniref:undecaprenyl-phosphate glucose phosphotransferase n=1 Tax=Allomuricauda sp. SCSIO 65647 TaxID=2908843 RepID=UPI001F35138D|nr:undecaprenyl-phosphate glucose phosphotransferase [Muricauda sp. SCSIO 65647]UJH69038.1 undecaprenyl-phosphate glucose phosphotransferase [Muricauda sp. SCSIO 65647]
MPINQRKFGLKRSIEGLADLLTINLLAYSLPVYFHNPILFYPYISLVWIIISYRNKFYEVYRYTKVTYILVLLFRQFVFMFLALYAYIGFFKQPNVSRLYLGIFFLLIVFAISALKFSKYLFLRYYRKKSKSDLRNVIVIGKNQKINQLVEVFNNEKSYGYQFFRQFSTSKEQFDLEGCLNYVVDNRIDEIYCSIEGLEDDQILNLINFADKNFKTVKFVPDNKQIFSKKLNFEYYDYVPVLSLKEIPLKIRTNYVLKRTFDIVFSSLTIVLLLSWLTPLMAIIISLESKGPVFFRQYRKGYDFKLFACYKFRSMAMNKAQDEQQATKNDMRVTKVGRFIRKTSMDELPQFYNVLMGNMSVVGPRPLLIKHTNDYVDKIQKFMLRHYVKPGITGLAQVKGYRGEIETDLDMKNRVRFDIFYVENWSLFLDLKIIFQTVLNVIKGEEKAY